MLCISCLPLAGDSGGGSTHSSRRSLRHTRGMSVRPKGVCAREIDPGSAERDQPSTLHTAMLRGLKQVCNPGLSDALPTLVRCGSSAAVRESRLSGWKRRGWSETLLRRQGSATPLRPAFRLRMQGRRPLRHRWLEPGCVRRHCVTLRDCAGCFASGSAWTPRRAMLGRSTRCTSRAVRSQLSARSTQSCRSCGPDLFHRRQPCLHFMDCAEAVHGLHATLSRRPGPIASASCARAGPHSAEPSTPRHQLV